MTELQSTIITIIRERQRCTLPQRGVYPHTVSCWLDDIYRHPSTVRRDMVNLWQAGYLERLGGARSRRGYKVAMPPVVQPALVSKPQTRPVIQWIPPISQLIRVA